jgi:hypothetical protein
VYLGYIVKTFPTFFMTWVRKDDSGFIVTSALFYFKYFTLHINRSHNLGKFDTRFVPIDTLSDRKNKCKNVM